MKEAVAIIMALGFATCLLSCCGSILARRKSEPRIATWRRAAKPSREPRKEDKELMPSSAAKGLISYFQSK